MRKVEGFLNIKYYLFFMYFCRVFFSSIPDIELLYLRFTSKALQWSPDVGIIKVK